MAIAVSDGSFKDYKGTSAFVIEVSPSQQLGHAIGVNAIPGEPVDQSPYRSELGGVSGIIATVHLICTVHGIQKGSIEVGLDGEQAMKAICGDGPLHTKQADYNLLQDIREKVKLSPLKPMRAPKF